MKYNLNNPLTVIELFAGYGSQHLALQRLKRDFPGFDYQVKAIAEIEPAAIKAYQAIHSDCPNLGDVSKIDWERHTELKGIGLVTYSFPCFVAGTLVHTTKGLIPIEDIATDDIVLTHTNSYQRVLRVGSRMDAPIIKVRGMCFKDIECTLNHPFYVRKHYKEWNNLHRRKERKFSKPEWLEAGKLTKGHYLGYAINQKSEFPDWGGVYLTRGCHSDNVNVIANIMRIPDFWYIMGRYVGDGWRRRDRNSRGIVICCSSRNRDSLENALKKCDINYCVAKERTVTKIHICSKEFHEFVGRYGYMAYGKCVDAETINLPKDMIRAFVDGYVDSDGCFTKNEYKTTTVSRELAYSMQQCIAKAYECPVRMYFCKRKPKAIIEGRKVNQHDTYSLVWHTEKRKQDKAFYEDGIVWFPINEIINEGKTATVYNMEVENDNSYTANGAIVHNCQDISNAGKQKGFARESGTRSGLLWECEKCFRALRPKYLLMENVKALTQKKFMPLFNEWIALLASLGYSSYWKVLNAKDYGVAQNRERVFMVSILRTEDDPNPTYNFPKGFPLSKCVEDYMEPAEDVGEEYYISQDRVTGKVLSDMLDQPNVREEMEKLYHTEWDFYQRNGRFPKDGELDDVSNTL